MDPTALLMESITTTDGADNAKTTDIIKPPPAHVPSQFPDKVMALLERKEAPEAVWWLRDVGDIQGAFAINKKIFSVQLLNKAFNGNKWPSITRNLNRWGYKQVSYADLPPYTTAYYHPFFQPNKPALLKQMVQDKSKAKAAIQDMELKKAKETALSRVGASSTNTSVIGSPGASSCAGATSIPGVLMLNRHSPNNGDAESLGSALLKSRSLQSPIGSPTGQQRNLASSLPPGFPVIPSAASDQNQIQLGLLQNTPGGGSGDTGAKHGTGMDGGTPIDEDTRSLLEAILAQQENVDTQAQAQQSQKNQQLFQQQGLCVPLLSDQVHQESNQAPATGNTNSAPLSQSALLQQQLQQQDALLVQLEMERKQRQEQQQRQFQAQQQQLQQQLESQQAVPAPKETHAELQQIVEQQEILLLQLQLQERQRQQQMNEQARQSHQEFKQQSPQLQPNDVLGGFQQLGNSGGNPTNAPQEGGANGEMSEQNILQQIFLRQQQQLQQQHGQQSSQNLS